MEKTHRAVLLSHRLTLAKELDIKEVCQFLVENGILSDRMVEEILSKPTDFDRNVAFLNKLPTRGPRAFEAFYNSLLETDQSFIAALLKQNNAPIGRSDCTDVGFAPSSFSMSTSPLAKSTPTKRSHSDMNSSFSPSSFEMSGVSGIQSKSCTIRSMGRSVLTEQNGNEELRQNKHCENSIGSRIPVENMDASNLEGDSPQSAAETSSSSMTYHLNSLRSNRSLESLHSIAGILPSTSTNHYTTAKFTTNRISNTNHVNDVTARNEDEDSVAMLVCDSPTTNHVTVKMASPEFLMEHAMDCYPMFGTCKGLALIINVENFEPSACLDDRAGADKDYARMELTLKQLSFEVYHLKNGTAVEIWNTLKNFAAWSKLAEADSCFIVLMSHGEDGAIYGRDGKTIPLPNIFDLFSNINCPHLQNKPKVFMVQACRGEDPDKGTDQIDGPTREKLRKRFTHSILGGEIVKNKLPTMSDCLIAYATVPEYAAMRNTSNGSWFIQAFLQVVAYHAKDKHLVDIMTLTNNQVKGREGWSPASEFHRCKEMSEFTSCLCKPLFFFPGLCLTENPARGPL